MRASALMQSREHEGLDIGQEQSMSLVSSKQHGGARGVMVIVAGRVDTTTRVQILDEADYISHSTNTLGKGMNPNILPSALVRRLV